MVSRWPLYIFRSKVKVTVAIVVVVVIVPGRKTGHGQYMNI